MNTPVFCSTIIPTIGRESLSKAVESILTQDIPKDQYEVVVVNDSGKPLAPADWMSAANVSIIATNRRNRSVARNTGAAVASGQYLHFLDDDDWILPGAYSTLMKLARETGAAWVYGAFRLVNNSGMKITDIYPDETGNCAVQLLAWEWLPLQASLISSSAFFSIGGFAPLPSLLGGFEDVDLSRQIALYFDMARLNDLVAVIRAGESGSTTNYVDMFKQNRQSREKFLSSGTAFSRLRDSARTSGNEGYWSGKVIYYYLASMKWNLRKRHVFAALSRLSHTSLAFLTAGKNLFRSNFWNGVIRPHYPRMSIALQQAGADHLYAETRKKIFQTQNH